MLHIPVAALFFGFRIGRRGEKRFMLELYARLGAKMFAVARSMTDSKQDAEDVVEEACISLMKKISLLRQLDCNVLESYVVSTVRNTAYSFQRRRTRRREVDDAETLLANTPDSEPDPEASLLQKASLEQLMQAIRQLPEADQVAIRMKYFEERSTSEIAEVLGVQECSVRSRLTRARKRLRELLKEEEL